MIAAHFILVYGLSLLAIQVTKGNTPPVSPHIPCISRKRIVPKQIPITIPPVDSNPPIHTVSSNSDSSNQKDVYFPWNDGYGLCLLF